MSRMGRFRRLGCGAERISERVKKEYHFCPIEVLNSSSLSHAVLGMQRYVPFGSIDYVEKKWVTLQRWVRRLQTQRRSDEETNSYERSAGSDRAI